MNTVSLIKVGILLRSPLRVRQNSELQVSSFKDIGAVITFFDKYPLITQKLADYLLFKQVFELISNKEHLTIEGLKKIIAIKASINKGLPEELQEAYSDIEPVNRCNVVNKEIPDPNWLVGFTSGEGCFAVRVFDSSHHQLGSQVQLRFQLTQQARDEELMGSIIKYLNCGRISKRGDIIDLHVTKLTDITENIIPWFAEYPVIGVKKENFEDFCKVAELMKKGAHRLLPHINIFI